MVRAITFGLALLGMLVAATAAAAAGPAQQLEAAIEQLLSALADPAISPAGRQDAFRGITRQTFDFEETARRALGSHWQERSPAERAEFVRLFTEFIERGYFANLQHYDGEKVEIVSADIDGDRALVRSRVVSRQADVTAVDYRMLRNGDDRWRVYDVVVGGVSLVGNYRAQFNKIIRSVSYDALVDRLRAPR